jgi:hypothetical protein
METADRLTKVDAIRGRTGLSYQEASELLDEAQGDVLQALILFEQRGKKQHGPQWETFEAKGNEILEKVKELVKRGNVTKIIIRKENRVIAEIPVTAGVIGAIISWQLALLGTAACLLGKCSIEIERQGEPKTELNLDEDGNPLN